jgi:hypothetical protein
MRRSVIVFGLGYAALSFFAILALAAMSESLIDLWRYQRPEDPGLHPWTLAAPTVARGSLVVPAILGVVSLLAFRRDLVSERVLVRVIAVTVVIQTVLTIFVVMSGMLPMMVTIVGRE